MNRTEYYEKCLEGKVKAKNMLNSEVNRLAPILKSIFTPLVGKTILKSGGVLMAKYKNLLPVTENNPVGVRYWHNISSYGLRFTVQSLLVVPSIDGDHGHSINMERMLSIGTLDRGVLISIDNYMPDTRIYTVEAIHQLREEYSKAKEIADEAMHKAHAIESELASFGLRDY